MPTYSTPHTNPYATDPDKAAIWEMLVIRDIEAYAAQDFAMVADDFVTENFLGFSGGHARDIANWGIKYPHLDDYRQDWLAQAAETAKVADMNKLTEALLKLSTLTSIEITGDTAVARKEFDGTFPLADGNQSELLSWQTLYICRKVNEQWKIAGFIGYLPRPLVP